MQEAEGGKTKTRASSCACPGTARGAAATCATGTAQEVQLGTSLPTPKRLRSQQAEADTTAAPLHPTRRSEGAVRSHREQGSAAAHIQALSLAGYTGCCGTVGSVRLKKMYPSSNWGCQEPAFILQNTIPAVTELNQFL